MLWLPSVQELVDLIIQGNDQEAGDAELVDLLYPAASLVLNALEMTPNLTECKLILNAMCCILGCCVVLLKDEND